MFITNLKEDFYFQLHGKRVLLLANHDVDSLCTCKILQKLFQDDGITYTIKPIQGIADMRLAYEKMRANVDVLILVNCGGSVDITEIIGKPRHPIYIIDSNKPVHILNIYDESKLVRVVTALDDISNIPSFDEVFREDHMEYLDEDSESGDEGGTADCDDVPIPGRKRKRGRPDPTVLGKRKQFIEWEQKRRQILHDYSKYTAYGTPTALAALELAWKLSKDQSEMIWWAAVSLSDSLILEKLSRATYLLIVTELQDHVARVSHAQSLPRDCLKVNFENDLCFLLYRHWNLYDSIKMTPYCAAKFRSWCYKGQQRYHEFLADAGLPLREVKQRFSSMDLSLRRLLKDIFCSERIRSKYHFDEVTIGTFTAQIGYQNKYGAMDVAIGALAVLESPEMESTPSEKFMNALDFLNKLTGSHMEKGLNMAKTLISNVYREIQTICDLNQLLVFGSFMCVQIQPGIDSKYYCHPNVARYFAQFMAKAVVSTRKDRQLYELPTILMTPQDNNDFHLVIGIPPIAVNSSHSILGRAFEHVAVTMKDTVIIDYFDPCILQVKSAEKQKFLDSLLLLLM